MIEHLEGRRLLSTSLMAGEDRPTDAAALVDMAVVEVANPARGDSSFNDPPGFHDDLTLNSSWLPGWMGGVITNDTPLPMVIWSSDNGWAELAPGQSTSGWEDWDYAQHPVLGWVKVYDLNALTLDPGGVHGGASGIHDTTPPWTPGIPPAFVPPYTPPS